MSAYLTTKLRQNKYFLCLFKCSFSGVFQSSNNSDTSFSLIICHLQEENVRLTNEFTCAKEKISNDFVILQQMEQKHIQSEINLQMALNEIDQVKEENVCYCSQVRRLNKKIEISKREVKKALLALHKQGRVARNHSKIGQED